MSKNYKKVRDYYNLGLWDLRKVTNAVGKWITVEEFEDITGLNYSRLS